VRTAVAFKEMNVLLFLVLLGLVVIVISIALYLHYNREQNNLLWVSEDENCFIDVADTQQKRKKFPSLTDDSKGTIFLTIVIPAYNEKDRLPKTMDETLNFLKRKKSIRAHVFIRNSCS